MGPRASPGNALSSATAQLTRGEPDVAASDQDGKGVATDVRRKRARPSGGDRPASALPLGQGRSRRQHSANGGADRAAFRAGRREHRRDHAAVQRAAHPARRRRRRTADARHSRPHDSRGARHHASARQAREGRPRSARARRRPTGARCSATSRDEGLAVLDAARRGDARGGRRRRRQLSTMRSSASCSSSSRACARCTARATRPSIVR